MGTHAILGFYYLAQYYLSYVHFDGYPSGVGVDLVREIRAAIADGTFASWRDRILQLQRVSREIPPTEEEIALLQPYLNLSVSEQSAKDRYCLLHGSHGSLVRMLEAGYVENQVDEQGRPIHEDYSYIVNFDDLVFQVYEYGKHDANYTFNRLPNW